ncbi:DUF4225 domain-containing protein [Pseudomonas soli]|uniref:DUF4225 domain-containing protein n=1 Tax=Pseudomonas soli TaxID=1306993 RepID=A0AAJ5MMP3_9PSED|nr:DUF4225 domain-containing protein [Pseudomonas soli]UXZ47463.1 DUF4225 domain-containing protein [Pseudomonas soli]
MSQREEYGDRLDEAYWEVNAAASRLISYGCGVSARHLQDRRLRMQFNRELAYYARRVMNDMYERKISSEDAIGKILAERNSLRSQSERISKQLIGLAGGASQIVTGIGICIGSMGAACAFPGAPMMAHGGNNLYENSKGLLTGRDDVVGPVRDAYISIAQSLGYSERDGNVAYYGLDLYLSYKGLTREVLKPNAWRLFYYLKADKQIALQQMSKAALGLEGTAGAVTLDQISKEYKK